MDTQTPGANKKQTSACLWIRCRCSCAHLTLRPGRTGAIDRVGNGKNQHHVSRGNGRSMAAPRAFDPIRFGFRPMRHAGGPSPFAPSQQIAAADDIHHR